MYIYIKTETDVKIKWKFTSKKGESIDEGQERLGIYGAD